MFYKMIEKKRDAWYKSPECTVKDLVSYIISTNQMRDAQVDAIKTYLFLKIACESKPLASLFISGAFNNIDISEQELKDSVKEKLKKNPAAAALYEYACLTNDQGEQVSKSLEKQIKADPSSIDYHAFFRNVFYNVSYTDYLFSLPMGAGKTYLMAAFIYLDLYFADQEPENPAFAHNFIILAPSGLKSSVIPSLKTIQNFTPSWILPEPSATNIKRMISFEVLDQGKTAKKSNKTKNPNVQKIANHQPLSELFGLVAVTNAEKVILDRIQEKDGQIRFEDSEDDRDRQANELRNLIGKLPALAVFIDEVHHAVSDEIKLRAVVTKWTENQTVNSVIGFSGTPYLEKPEKITVTEKLKVATAEITNIVYYYPLVKGVGNFLKKPTIKITENATSSEIIEKGVREFLKQYKDKVYSNGLTAKLGIYCGTIEKLEEIVYPLVSSVVAEYGLPGSCILKFHRGNKQYPMPADAQMEFDILDSALSKIRIVLLVQIGKEGWDCRSLTGIILSQEGDCPTNMVLQTSCRCLRQVDRGVLETALISLNAENAQKLEAQLKKQHHTSLAEFQSADHHKATLQWYNRMDHLKLPKIDFYQLKIQYETLIAEKANPAEAIPYAADNAAKGFAVTYETDLAGGDRKNISVDDAEKGTVFTTYRMWLNDLVKGSFGTLTFADLQPFEPQLRDLFERVTFEKNDSRFFTSKIRVDVMNANVRKAFADKREFTTQEETIPATASLLRIKDASQTIFTDTPEKYIPDQKTAENIVLDDAGKLKIDANVQKAIDLLRQAGDAYADKLIADHVSHKNKDRIYHYLPYRTDSGFERVFYQEIANLDLLSDLGLEVYYNGDRAMTDFKIRCYRKSGARWSYIGMYTPDFLIIQRKDGKIFKAIIVETKGGIYANDPTFKEKRAFMETQFVGQNNAASRYQRFEYLYLEDTLSDSERITKTITKMKGFFKEE